MIKIFKKNRLTDFGKIEIGDAFIFDNEIYIKINYEDKDGYVGAVNTRTWNILTLGGQAGVQKTDLEIKEV